MASYPQIAFTKVDSGSSISEVVGLGNGWLTGIWAPVVDSCDLFLQGSFDQTSANFVRAVDTNFGAGGSGYSDPFKWAVGPGSEAIIMHSAYRSLPYARVEMGVSQTDTRTLAFIIAFD